MKKAILLIREREDEADNRAEHLQVCIEEKETELEELRDDRKEALEEKEAYTKLLDFLNRTENNK